MTKLQREVLNSVLKVTNAGGWYRAGQDGRGSSGGQRVTLASLYYRGALVRRAWRGKEGHPDAANEYRFAGTVGKLREPPKEPA